VPRRTGNRARGELDVEGRLPQPCLRNGRLRHQDEHIDPALPQSGRPTAPTPRLRRGGEHTTARRVTWVLGAVLAIRRSAFDVGASTPAILVRGRGEPLRETTARGVRRTSPPSSRSCISTGPAPASGGQRCGASCSAPAAAVRVAARPRACSAFCAGRRRLGFFGMQSRCGLPDPERRRHLRDPVTSRSPLLDEHGLSKT